MPPAAPRPPPPAAGRGATTAAGRGRGDGVIRENIGPRARVATPFACAVKGRRRNVSAINQPRQLACQGSGRSPRCLWRPGCPCVLSCSRALRLLFLLTQRIILFYTNTPQKPQRGLLAQQELLCKTTVQNHMPAQRNKHTLKKKCRRWGGGRGRRPPAGPPQTPDPCPHEQSLATGPSAAPHGPCAVPETTCDFYPNNPSNTKKSG